VGGGGGGGQPYARGARGADGDRVDWFSVGPVLAAAIARAIDPDCDPTHPFRAAFVVSSSAIYYRQRRFLNRLRNGDRDPFLIEQEVVGLVGSAMEAGYGRMPNDQCVTSRASRDAIESARAELARDPAQSVTVRELARRVSLSPFHLCRLFRRQTGSTVHDYILELRLRLALERLEDGAVDLSRVSHDIGFSSHSHFSATFRRRLGVSPSRVRCELAHRGNEMRNLATATRAPRQLRRASSGGVARVG
jgi:AraC-like DNA-binding protein